MSLSCFGDVSVSLKLPKKHCRTWKQVAVTLGPALRPSQVLHRSVPKFFSNRARAASKMEARVNARSSAVADRSLVGLA